MDSHRCCRPCRNLKDGNFSSLVHWLAQIKSLTGSARWHHGRTDSDLDACWRDGLFEVGQWRHDAPKKGHTLLLCGSVPQVLHALCNGLSCVDALWIQSGRASRLAAPTLWTILSHPYRATMTAASAGSPARQTRRASSPRRSQSYSRGAHARLPTDWVQQLERPLSHMRMLHDRVNMV
jgi:hypothetical protein